MMKFKSIGVLALSVFVLYGCSKATSKPQYKYRKSVGDGVAASTGSVKVTHKELYEGIESELYEAEMKIFDIKFNKLNELIIQKLIKNDPSSKGMTRDQYFDKHIAGKLKVSDKEVNAFIKERKIPTKQINPQVREKIVNYLSMQKKDDAIKSWLGEKTSKSGIEIFFEKPERPTFDVSVGNAPFFGGENAKVSIVEFSDFQCPFCAEGAKILKKLKAKYGKKVKIAFKQFPLPFHTQAKKAAMASLCMHEQKPALFWKMHDKMFAGQDKLGVDELKESAKALGADTAKFDKCLDDNKYMGQIEKDMQQGKKVGVKSTPTFFVNGKLVAGALPLDVFSELIDSELAK
ncbi:MAG: DsbA family protein [Halobacteriovoraceae bacterium]|jgi:protein-disulfide isomerase|nr:DsbA family protein [Halobacteriovoraceae bacterium]